jgi:hypothetical protein
MLCPEGSIIEVLNFLARFSFHKTFCTAFGLEDFLFGTSFL